MKILQYRRVSMSLFELQCSELAPVLEYRFHNHSKVICEFLAISFRNTRNLWIIFDVMFTSTWDLIAILLSVNIHIIRKIYLLILFSDVDSLVMLSRSLVLDMFTVKSGSLYTFLYFICKANVYCLRAICLAIFLIIISGS